VYTQRSNDPYALNTPLRAVSPNPDLPQLLDNRSFDEKEVVIFTPIADLNLELQKTPLVVINPTLPPSGQNDAPSVPIENPNSGFWIVILILVGLGLVIFVVYQRKNRKGLN
ncbi:hypothetical protein, partial [Thermaurantimonas aggregans]|uniref:hypothetical protein n=1 Tax=Thermaurantimonas aggregans TaxID=2173829 RepID=UPI0023F1842C